MDTHTSSDKNHRLFTHGALTQLSTYIHINTHNTYTQGHTALAPNNGAFKMVVLTER